MQAYHFINYNSQTNTEHIRKYAEHQAILCFDFEDSIKISDKPYYRNCFRNILNNIIKSMPSTQIGVRINSDLSEMDKDLEAISYSFINSIFLPKVETVKKINIIRKLLDENKISYDELIPIIETKTALKNIESIIENLPPKTKRLTFGHCDYNLNIKVFPFFHQECIEYWKWIKRIYSVIHPKGLSIVNSAYLELGNDSFFQSMLNHLYNIFGDDSGQTALTSRQSEMIKLFTPANNYQPFNKFIKHRLDLRVPLDYEKQIIEKFERNKKNKTFSVTIKNNVLISPHEYFAAKAYCRMKKSKSINFTFVGGCFPVQTDILFEDLFHQRLKRKIESKLQIEFNINIIRYEQFNTCLDKLRSYNESHPIDILVFHIRPEPYLRLVKIYYRYINTDRKKRHSLNIPKLNIIKSEKYDVLNSETGNIFYSARNETWLHKQFVDLNYKIGAYLGNLKFALNKYFELTFEIAEYCRKTNIKLLILGVAYRNNTSYALKLCDKLDIYMQNKFEDKNITYIESLSYLAQNPDQYFQENGIHASEKYHELIATLLYNELKVPLVKFEKANKRVKNIIKFYI